MKILLAIDETPFSEEAIREVEDRFMRTVAGNRWLSDFSLRRNGEAERAVDVASYAFIGDFNDTSKCGGCLPARHSGNWHGRTLLAQATPSSCTSRKSNHANSRAFPTSTITGLT